MYKRRIFTVDPQYFPLNRMREIVNFLHTHDQRFGRILPNADTLAATDGFIQSL